MPSIVTPVFANAEQVDQLRLIEAAQPGTVAELLGHFSREVESCLGVLAAAGTDQMSTARAAAHSLKGSSSMLGASEVSRLAAVIEQEARAGRLSSDHIGQLRAAVDLFIPWLRSQVV